MSPSKQEFIEYLRRYRHDWLNHLQIVKGYLALGKIDEVQKVLDHVIMDTHYESKVSQIGDVELAYYLLTYNWTQNKVNLEVEVDSDSAEIASIGKNNPYLISWVKEMMDTVEECCIFGEENHLLLLFFVTEGKLTLTVEFEGSWRKQEGEDALGQLKERIDKERGTFIQGVHNEHEFTCEILSEV